MRFFLRQLVLAMTWACAALLLGEIVMPGLVLPFLNLHLFVVAVLAANLIPLERETQVWWQRAIAVVPVAFMLGGYTWLLLSDHGPSAILLAMGINLLLAGASIAMIFSYAEH